jgi:hypothetical protein
LGLPLAHVLRLPTWIDELLGTLRGNQRYGVLVRFFFHIARFLTHQLFADESNTRAWLTRLRSGIERDPLQEAELLGFPVQPMTPGEVDRVFGAVLALLSIIRTNIWTSLHVAKGRRNATPSYIGRNGGG